VEVLRVEERSLRLSVETQGTVMPRTETTLIAEVAGKIESVAPVFEAGGVFAKGEILVRIDRSDYETAIAAARADVARSRLRLAEEEALAEQARRDWIKLGEGEASDLVLRQPQLAEVRAAAEAAEAALGQARRNLERTEVRAPYDGLVKEKFVDVGQYVTGLSGNALAVIYAIDFAEIRLPINDHELAYLEVSGFNGEKSSNRKRPRVVLKAEFGGKSRRWEGVIDRTEGLIDARSRLVYVVAQVEDPYGMKSSNRGSPLPMGLFVEAQIDGKRIDEVFLLPRAAVVEGDRVLVVDNDNKLFARPVSIIQRDTRTVVIDDGLEDGERICLSPVEFVVKGMTVDPLEIDWKEPGAVATAEENSR
jgi:RND family efflux transporter MFP subunit